MPKRNFFLKTISSVEVRSRGYLPHWELSGATYSVTFRLLGSLPRHVVDKLQEWRRARIRMITAGVRELSPAESMDLRAEFEDQLDVALHAASGPVLMRDPAIAGLVAGSLTYFDRQRYTLDAWCVMPNHVHVIFTPFENWRLDKILHTWKSYTAKEANRLLGRQGGFWEREYYDRIVRDERDHADAIAYVLANPEKAGLVNWKWKGVGRGGA